MNDFVMNRHTVQKVVLSDQCCFEAGVLQLNPDQLRDMVLANEDLASASVSLCCPGDNTRVIHILDAIKPVCKVDGGGVFPGVLGQPHTTGSGETHVLDGVSLMTCGLFPQSHDPILRVREAIVDMSGVNAHLSPFSAMFNVVVTLEPSASLTLEQADKAMRAAGAQLAAFMAGLATESPADRRETLELARPDANKPNVCAILQLASIGPLFDTFIYGRTVDGMLPTLVHPAELMDGIVMTGEYFYGGQRIPTCHHQESPVLSAMLQNGEANLVGVIVTRGYQNTLYDKKRGAVHCAQLARMLGADGAVITIESGGNSHTDAMLTCQACEQEGISTVVIVGEMADTTSKDLGLVDYVKEATAIISAGNRELLVDIPAAERVLGGQTILDLGTPPETAQTLPLHNYFCATSQVGAARLTMKSV